MSGDAEYDSPEEKRYCELVDAVYDAARNVVEGWGIAESSDVAALLDEGLADDMWTWVREHVPGVADQAQAIHDGDLPAAVRAVLDNQLWQERWHVDAYGNDEANGWVGPARTVLAKAVETRVRATRGGRPAWVESEFEDLRDWALWQRMLDHAREDAGIECEQRGCDCECHGAA